MGGKRIIILATLAFLAAGCAASVPRWRDEAHLLLDNVRREGAEKLLPAEYHSVEDALFSGDSLLSKGDADDAEEFFRLAWNKGKLLEQSLLREQERQQEQARQKREAERQAALKQAREEEERRRLDELAAAQKAYEEALLEKKKHERAKTAREVPTPLPDRHTVKRGETLPQIAAQPDVYNDISLWPLLYRANRDQISDPRHIWPGQVLKIPRNLTREDLVEARRYAQERRLY